MNYNNNIIGVAGQVCTADGTKCDNEVNCAGWSQAGECDTNPGYMLLNCAASCDKKNNKKTKKGSSTGGSKSNIVEVDDDETETTAATETAPEVVNCEDGMIIGVDHHQFCHIWAQHGECEKNPRDMHKHCAKSCSICMPFDVVEEDERFINEKKANDTSDDPINHPRCINKHENCFYWANQGHCIVNPQYMEIHCAKACKTCEKLEPIVDPMIAKAKLLSIASKEFGIQQSVDGATRGSVAEIIEKSVMYLASIEKQTDELLELCQNRNALCSYWAFVGECENNPEYMHNNCGPACKSCDLIDAYHIVE